MCTTNNQCQPITTIQDFRVCLLDSTLEFLAGFGRYFHLTDTNLERKRKLSVWVRRIIQPNKEQAREFESAPQQCNTIPRDSNGTSNAGEALKRHSTHPSAGVNARHGKKKESRKSHLTSLDATLSSVSQPHVEFDACSDNASIAPLVSQYSASASVKSMKSSVFSESTSLQSTRATVLSSKTLETNSSTVGIPPASIVDRARYNANAGHGAASSIFSLTTTHHASRANSLRQFPLPRNNSTHTINTEATQKTAERA
ncbi:LAMI_0G14554g1_1 [Lachancea mirantina]|uniref:LAMI_0G14554g1_1 n=1 Tax=Lachancea mirantina TaxID=1230905 RepID=A0A1G4KC71_9SACH|nr:LAMI_0G14554g1_1 [Lachancea mirantina]